MSYAYTIPEHEAAWIKLVRQAADDKHPHAETIADAAHAANRATGEFQPAVDLLKKRRALIASIAALRATPEPAGVNKDHDGLKEKVAALGEARELELRLRRSSDASLAERIAVCQEQLGECEWLLSHEVARLLEPAISAADDAEKQLADVEATSVLWDNAKRLRKRANAIVQKKLMLETKGDDLRAEIATLSAVQLQADTLPIAAPLQKGKRYRVVVACRTTGRLGNLVSLTEGQEIDGAEIESGSLESLCYCRRIEEIAA